MLHHLVDLNGEITAGAGSERRVHALTKLRMQRRVDRGETRERPARLRVGCRVVVAQQLFPSEDGTFDDGEVVAILRDLPNLLEARQRPRVVLLESVHGPERS